MYRYLLMNLVFMVVIGLVVLRLRVKLQAKAVAKTLIVLLVLTAIFDTIMISLELFSYNELYILGLSLGKAPVEDFMYPVLAAVLIPALWEFNKRT